MSNKSNIQNQYNATCARLGETEYRLAALEQEKSSLIKQLSELQKAWTMVESLEKTDKDASDVGPSAQ